MIALEEAARVALRWFESQDLARLGVDAISACVKLRRALAPWGGSLPAKVEKPTLLDVFFLTDPSLLASLVRATTADIERRAALQKARPKRGSKNVGQKPAKKGGRRRPPGKGRL